VPFSLTPFASPHAAEKRSFRARASRDACQTLGEAGHGELASKADITGLKADVGQVKAEISQVKAGFKADIAEARAELKAGIAEVKADILNWAVGAIGFQTAVILGAFVSLVR
jgi:hypothetical protein